VSQIEGLVGKWSKLERTSCNEKYPDILEFMKNGLYSGSKGENANEYTLWDTGDYKVVSENQIKISTANDKIVRYNYFNRDNVLTFEDEEKCQVQYKRIE